MSKEEKARMKKGRKAKVAKNAKRGIEASVDPTFVIQTPEAVRERAKPLDADAMRTAVDADTDAARERKKARTAAKRRLDALQAEVAATHGAKVKEYIRGSAPLATESEPVTYSWLGALNIDASRIGHASEADLATSLAKNPGRDGETVSSDVYGAGRPQQSVNTAGRWPANVALDESQAAALDAQSGTTKSRSGKRNAPKGAGTSGAYAGDEPDRLGHSDTGGASRFFYVAKAPKSERPVVDGTAHPTVKPLALMRWLCRLVTPSGGVVVDPFAGSGTTLEAAYLEGFESIGVEMTPEYWPLIAARIERVTR